jgi:hypothetical protein
VQHAIVTVDHHTVHSHSTERGTGNIMRSIGMTSRRLRREAATHRGTAGGDESARPTSSRLGMRFGALAGAAGVVFAASIAVPPVASAQEYHPFDIWNIGSADVTLAYYSPWGGTQYRKPTYPVPGMSIRPGQNFHIVLIKANSEDLQRVVVHLSGRGATATGQAQKWAIDIGVDMSIYCSTEGDKPPAHQTAYCGSYIGKGGNVATVADEPGYKVTIPASDTAKQDQLNQDLCQNPYKTQLNIVCTDTPDALVIYAGWTTWTLQHKK